MNNLLISIDSSLRANEKVLRRFDISVPAADSRKEQALMTFGVTVIFSCMLFGLVLLSRVSLHFINLAILVAIGGVFWKIFDRFLRFTFPDFSELLVTNQRLILRAGSGYTEWISDYDCEIEVFVIADIASFAVRPVVVSCSPREVYVKSRSPFEAGKELADLLRSMREKSLIEDRNSAYTIGGANRADSNNGSAIGASIPPGIIVTHAFLCNQLRSIVAAIPLLSFVEAEQIVSQYRLAPLEASALPAAVFPENASASETTESSPDSDLSLDLGATGYQFGVDQQP